MKQFRRINDLLGWLVFAIATVVYFLTLEPTASWWDCGEYIATAFKLQVGHPPGAPFFQLVGRFFTLFAFGDTSKVAMMINGMSAISSSLTIMFLFWTISLLGRKLMPEVEKMTLGHKMALFGSALVGSLAYAFSDTFWFSAVEGEVYAMSSFFTALVFWAILKWDLVADEPHANRWLVLIAFIIGLTIGVHLLNLLALPAVAYVYFFRKYQFSWKGAIYTGLISVILLFVTLYGIIPWVVDLSARFELFFVNSIKLPFNTGTIIYFILLIALIVYGLSYAKKKAKPLLQIGVLSFAFLLIGYSSFFMLIIRSNANTPIDENNPEDAISLLSYLNREQYGSNPIFYGQYYNAPLDPRKPYKDGRPVYRKDKAAGKYIIADDRKGNIPNYDSRFKSIFPRMWSSQKSIHIQEYERWGGKGGIPIQVRKGGGETETLYRPTMGQNLRYFFRYQIGHMYFRYFMWNFAGRQNDVQGHGSLHEGNWISGITFLDEMRLGNLKEFPEPWLRNVAHNKFFMLPLLLGLIGLFFHIRKHGKGALLVGLLFLMTGLAIIIYLNQYAYQPRERDYAYAGSFYAFSIWIGLGVIGLYENLRKVIPGIPAALTITLATLVLVPGIMAKEGWDDHDRSGKTAARDFAEIYLNSCAPNAILLTNGDNDTFPLWYAQEVEGIRTDMRVVNYMLASGSWYVHQLATKVYDSEPLPLSLTKEQYERGTNDYVPYVGREGIDRINVEEIVRFIGSDQQSTKVQMQSGKYINYFPTKKFRLMVDSAACVDNGIVPRELADQIVPYIEWDVKKNHLFKNDLMLLDFLANFGWSRPLYFASPAAIDDVFDFSEYCHLDGFVYRFMPVRAKNYLRRMGGLTNVDVCYDKLMSHPRWGNLEKPDVSVDRESYRNSAIPRNNFLQLAQALIRENRKEDAIAALDRVLEKFPDHKIMFDMYMLGFIDMYYQAEAMEKGDDVARKIAYNYTEMLDYYDSLRPDHARLFSSDRQQALAVMNNIFRLAQEYGRDDIKTEAEQVMQAHMPQAEMP